MNESMVMRESLAEVTRSGKWDSGSKVTCKISCKSIYALCLPGFYTGRGVDYACAQIGLIWNCKEVRVHNDWAVNVYSSCFLTLVANRGVKGTPEHTQNYIQLYGACQCIRIYIYWRNAVLPVFLLWNLRVHSVAPIRNYGLHTDLWFETQTITWQLSSSYQPCQFPEAELPGYRIYLDS